MATQAAFGLLVTLSQAEKRPKDSLLPPDPSYPNHFRTTPFGGAHLQQGTIYAEMKNKDETIGAFNLYMWYVGGVILDVEINGGLASLGGERVGPHLLRHYAANPVIEQVFPEALDIISTAQEFPVGILYDWVPGYAYQRYKMNPNGYR